jgi:transposase
MREVLDRVHVDETNRVARAAGVDPVRERRRLIKGARWLLLRNARHLQRKERARLQDRLAMNRRPWVVFLLKDALKALWRFTYRGAAHRGWRPWYGWAIRSRIPALIRFAQPRRQKRPGILAHGRYPLHTGVLGGINNKSKVIKRIASGFRNDASVFLEIRNAFPGLP